MKSKDQKRSEVLKEHFEQQRFSSNHLGMGDIRITVGQQDEIVKSLESSESEIQELREENKKQYESEMETITKHLQDVLRLKELEEENESLKSRIQELEEKVKNVARDAWYESRFQTTSYVPWEECTGEKHPDSIDVEDWLKQQGL